MEEVWEGISLSSLNQVMPSTDPAAAAAVAAAASLTSVRGMVLQDFLTRGGNPKGGGAGDRQQPSEEEEPDRNHPRPQSHGIERQRKRMLCNRESAARSRARKRAYTDELEKEAGRLRRENRALAAKNDELQKTVEEEQLCVATKRTLPRTLTAPF